MWTLFWDMYSGGDQKEPWAFIYIEASEEEAKVIFYNRFGHSAERVTCTCCGVDYSTDSHKSLPQLSGYHRNCRALETPRGRDGLYMKIDNPAFQDHYYLEDDEDPPAGFEVSSSRRFGEYVPFEEWLAHDGEKNYTGPGSQTSFKLIRATDIQGDERKGEVPEQGYVWRD